MAVTFRLYRSVRIGDNLTPRTSFRNKLGDPPFSLGEDLATGAGFWDWIHDARPVRYTLVACESALHTTIAADPEIIPLSPEQPSIEALQTWLDAPLAGVSQTVSDRLENDGISLAWISGGTTRRDAFRYAALLHVAVQDLKRLKDTDSMAFFAGGLDAKVNTLPVVARQKANAWIQGKGLDTSWITPSQTTLRQVIHYVLQNVNWPQIQFGPHRL